MLRRIINKAVLGVVKNALAAGESGWVNLASGETPLQGAAYSSKSGKAVSATSALSISAAWACVTRNAQLIGSLPVALYERQPDGNRMRIENDLSAILTHSPCAGLTGMEFWEAQTAAMLLQGNGYAEKQMIGRRMVGLRPLFRVTPQRRADGRFEYRVTEDGKTYTLPPEKVFHLRGFGGGDGLGMSVIKFGVQSLGSAIAADETAGRVFQNSMMPSGVLSSEQSLDKTQREQLQNLLAQYVSSDKAGKILTLEAGLKFDKMQMSPEDAQLLDTRRFQVEDVCRWFGTPPMIIGHAAQGQTMWGTGVEAIMLAWLTLGINPMLRRIEARVSKDLIPPEKRGKWFLEWNREAMLQMDSKAKADFLSKMVSGGIMTSDEARDKLNLTRRGGAADELRAQVATAPIETLGKDSQ